MDQLDIFEFLDDTLARFQRQVNFKIIRYRKNWSWESQNREEWFLYYLDDKGNEKCKSVYTMGDLTIVRGLDGIDIKFEEHDDQVMKCIYYRDKLVAFEPDTNVYVPA